MTEKSDDTSNGSSITSILRPSKLRKSRTFILSSPHFRWGWWLRLTEGTTTLCNEARDFEETNWSFVLSHDIIDKSGRRILKKSSSSLHINTVWLVNNAYLISLTHTFEWIKNRKNNNTNKSLSNFDVYWITCSRNLLKKKSHSC
jgi:hypothetical protein